MHDVKSLLCKYIRPRNEPIMAPLRKKKKQKKEKEIALPLPNVTIN